MKYAVSLICTALLSTNLLFAQVEVEIREDDPNFAALKIQAGLGFEVIGESKTLFELGSYYQLKNTPIELEVSMLTALTNNRKNREYKESVSDNIYKNFSEIGVGMTFNFYDKTKDKSLYVNLDNQKAPKEFTTIDTEIIAQSRGRLGMRGGFFRFTQSLMDKDATGGTLSFDDGTIFPIITEISFPINDTKISRIFTSETHVYSYFGFSTHFSNGISLNAKDYGLKKSKRDLTFYTDVLFALNSTVEEISYNSNLYDPLKSSTGVELNKIGYRIGMKHVMNKSYFSIEYGSRPNYFLDRSYFQIVLGYSFNKNI